MKYIQPLALLYIIIGSLNWLLIGVLNFNFVHFVFGKLWLIENIIYIIIGLSALVCIPMLKSYCPKSTYNKD